MYSRSCFWWGGGGVVFLNTHPPQYNPTQAESSCRNIRLASCLLVFSLAYNSNIFYPRVGKIIKVAKLVRLVGV